ncbi:MAG: hypothetical protein ACRD1R_13550 [Acidobacteriota bacterium]
MDNRKGDILHEDAFRQVELAVGFKKITCYNCGFDGFYKYRVQQIRRTSELTASEEDEIRPDHVDIWKTVPRFAEIPETVKCKRCNEVLGLYTACIF